MKVLLVEDEAPLSDVLGRGLKAHGHDVRQAGSAEAAVLSILDDLPDAVVLDIGLPHPTGWDVLRLPSTEDEVKRLAEQHREEATLFLLGEPRVNVRLNLALDAAARGR